MNDESKIDLRERIVTELIRSGCGNISGTMVNGLVAIILCAMPKPHYKGQADPEKAKPREFAIAVNSDDVILGVRSPPHGTLVLREGVNSGDIYRFIIVREVLA